MASTSTACLTSRRSSIGGSLQSQNDLFSSFAPQQAGRVPRSRQTPVSAVAGSGSDSCKWLHEKPRLGLTQLVFFRQFLVLLFGLLIASCLGNSPHMNW